MGFVLLFIMAFFDVDDKQLVNLYKRAWSENGHNPVGPRDNQALERSLMQYAKENNCSFDEAFRIAKTGKKR